VARTIVDEHIEEMKGFKNEIYNIVEEYLVNQTTRIQQNFDDSNKKLVNELASKVAELEKKIEDLQPKIHTSIAKAEKIEKLRMEKLKNSQ
jgi:hypothetical protein